jgi:heterodisulfide reductase subunit A
MGVAIKYKTENGEENTRNVEMLILVPALEPRLSSARLAEILAIPLDGHGFFSEKESDVDSVDTSREGVFIAGCAQSPKDVPDTVAEAEATVGRILSLSRQGS